MEYPLFNTKFLLLINFRFKSDLVFKPHYVHTHSRLNVNYMWFRIQTTSGGSLKSDLNKIQFETSSVNAKQDLLPN